MTTIDENLKSTDITQLAQLQISCLPDSPLSKFGIGFAESLFRYFDRSSNEILLVERIKGKIESAAVISCKIETLSVRLLVNTNFIWHSPFFIWRKDVWSSFLSSAVEDMPVLPQLFILMTSEENRSTGIGSHLVSLSNKILSDFGYNQYCVRTSVEEDNLATKFYLKNNFVEVDSNPNSLYRVLVKNLE